MNQLINRFDKEQLYYHYLIIVGYNNAKEYKNITKVKMIEAIIETFINDPNIMLKTIEIDVIRELKAIINGSKILEIKDLSETYNSTVLQKLFALDIIADNLIIRDDIKTIINNLEITLEDEEYSFYKLVVQGMILAYGAISFNSINSIYNDNRPNKYKHLKSLNIEELQYFLDELFYSSYEVYTDALVHDKFDEFNLKLVEINKTYDLQYYRDLYEYKVPSKYIETMNNLTDKDRFTPYIFKSMYFDFQIPEYFDKNEKYLNQLLERNNELTILLEIHNNIPMWIFGGLTITDVQEENFSQSDTWGLKLEYHFGVHFANYFNNFIYYANERVKLKKRYTNSEEFLHNTSERDSVEILNKTIRNRKIIMKYQNSLDQRLSPYIKEFNRAIDNAIVLKGAFFIGFDDEGRAMVLNNKKIYHIVGLSRDMAQVLRGSNPIRMIDVTLLPLEKYICYYFFINTYAIDLGKNIVKEINNEIEKAKHVYTIDDILKPLLN